MKTNHAKVHFNEQGTPVADDFGDVYFSNDSGIDETMHVFIAGNQLPERWITHTEPHFVIAETGFGTGLNCLVAMQEFARFRARYPQHPLKRLFIITTEKFPLRHADLAAALEHFPAVMLPANALLEQYPCALAGCHRLQLADFDTTLDIWMGDIHSTLPQLHAPVEGLVDAWFLDGFAPSKNPDMWTDDLFAQMARLSKQDCRFATFTAAGIVKRGLQEQGFEVQKVKGFGRKRDMLTGCYGSEKEADQQRFPRDWPYYRYLNQSLTGTTHVAIVGAGLAAASCALSLVERGIKVTLFTKGETLADGASGNRQGGFYPQLHAEASPPSLIQSHGFLFASRFYRKLAQHQSFDYDWCGVIQLDFNESTTARHKKLSENQIWPQALIRYINSETASELSGVPLTCGGLHIAQGGWINPAQLVEALVHQALETGLLEVIYNRDVSHIDTTPAPRLHFANTDEELEFDHVIMATGAGSVNTLLNTLLPLRPVRGQVEDLPAQENALGNLQTVLCHKGYLTPATHGRQSLGSTYVKEDLDTQVRATETSQNIATHQKALPKQDWAQQITTDGQARAAVRLGLPDHQVACGALPRTAKQQPQWQQLAKGKPLALMEPPPTSRVHMLAGLGSRGLTTAPIMAETLASQLCGEPLPLPESLLQAVSPQRFVIRQCIRNQLQEG